MKVARTLILVACLLGLAACSRGGLHAFEAWTRPTPQGELAAVYLLIHNDSSQDDALLGASTEAARVVEMHQNMIMGEGASESTMMMPVDRVALPAGQEVVFEPGGLHLMLVDLTNELNAGDRFTLMLHFENTADVEIEVAVESP